MHFESVKAVPVPPGCHRWRCRLFFCLPSRPVEWTAPPGSSPCRRPLHPAEGKMNHKQKKTLRVKKKEILHVKTGLELFGYLS